MWNLSRYDSHRNGHVPAWMANRHTCKNAEVPRKQPRLLDPHAGDALNGFLLNFLEYEWVFDYDRQEG